jgi:hypothetical protein
MLWRSVRQTVGSGSPRSYAAAVAGLWIDLRGTLARLDGLARDVAALSEDDCTELRSLQYELHCAAESVAGFTPPDDRDAEHAELADALAEARELTAEVADALERRGFEAATLAWEWRGALFRVRFARVRLDRPRPVRMEASVQRVPVAQRPPVMAAGAVALGSVLVLLAALLGLWLLVALTLAGTLAASVFLHP